MNIFTKSKYGILLLFLLCFSVYGIAQPLNDECSNAQAVTTGTYTFNTSTATASGQTTCNTNPADFTNDIWYVFSPNCSADITFSLCGSSYDTYLDIYSGACGALTCVASNNDDPVCGPQSQIFLASPTVGVTYYIRVGGVAGASGPGQLELTSSDNTPPVISGCPVNQTVNNAPGTCGASVTWTPPTGFDNCDFQGLTTTHAPGTVFPIGSTVVVYTASDAAGNTSTCSFVITVVDTEPPVVSGCPGNIVVSNDPNDCGAIVNWTEPTATDNCAIVLTNQSHTPGTFFNIGTTTVTYTWEDASGNVSTCAFDVTVNDTQMPVASCFPNVTLNLNAAGIVVVGILDIDAGSTDNCAFTVEIDTDTLTCANIGVPVMVTLTITDASGNIATCQSSVTVEDNMAPTATCQDITVYLDGTGNATIVATDIDGGSFDNCGNLTYSASQTAFDCTNLGANNVTLTVDDGNGQTANCIAVVTVMDTVAPVISGCPANITVSSGASCTAVVNWTEPSASDNCDGAVAYTSRSHAPGTSFNVGTTTVTYTFVDASGNTSTCSFDVLVQDNVLPTIACPADITVNNDAGVCGAVINYVAPTFGDNCPGATMAQTAGLPSGSVFPVGITSNTFVVTDASGNTAECTFTVTVNDTEPPVVTCPADIIVSADPGSCDAVVTYSMPTVTDNCPPSTANYTQTTASFTSYNMTGAAVLGSNDDQLFGPTTLPFTFEFYGTSFTNVYSSTNAFISFDNTNSGCCQGLPLPNGVYTNSIFAAWSDWVTTVNYRLIGTAPNRVAVFEFIGSAFGGGGNIHSQIALHEGTNEIEIININVSNTTYIRTEGLNLDGTTADPVPGRNATTGWTTTNERIIFAPAGNLMPVQTAGLPSGSVFPIGTTTNTFIVTDASGNTATCSFNVTVNDTEAPVITCPADIAVNNDPGLCGATVTIPVPAVVDNCDPAPSLTNDFTGTADASGFYPVGTTVVTYTSIDASGNIGTCSFTVVVTDVEAPVMTCPADIIVSTVQGDCSQLVSWTMPTAIDNCAGAVTVTSSHPNPGLYPVGTTLVTLTASDAFGNTTTCTFNITVEDNENPVITGCPSNITMNAAPGFCGMVVSWTQPTASDNCPGVTMTASHNPSTFFPIGTTTVTYTAVDASGNGATCTFTVTIIDNQPPVISNCPANIMVSNDAGACGAVVNWTPPTATDNCIFVTWTSTHNPGDFFPIGTTTVLYTAMDASGNTATCSFDVTVNDVEFPVVSGCPANINMSNDAGVCGATVTWTVPTFTDNCSFTLTASHTPGTLFPIGTTTVTYTATDPSGNTTICTFNVTVNDTENPVIAGCPANINMNNDPGDCGAIVTWTAPTATDNCGIASFVASHNPGDFFSVGVTTVTYTATDVNGNVSVCSFDITITDIEFPIVTCPANITVNNDAGDCGAFVTVPQPLVTDNCPPALQTVTVVSENFNSCSTGAPAGWSTNILVGSVDWTFDTGNMPTSTDFTTCAAIFDDVSGNNVVRLLSPVVNLQSYSTATVNFDYNHQDFAGDGEMSVEVWDGTAWVQIFFVTVDQIGTVNANVTPYLNANFQVRFTYDDNNSNAWGVGIDNFSIVGEIAQFSMTNNFNNTDDASDIYPVGTTTVVWTVTDPNGNSSTCSVDVTVVDNENPVIANCPANIVTCDGAGPVSWTAPTATDNCGVTSFTSSHNPGDIFPIGTTTVTYTATDAAGNSVVCSFDVTVNAVITADAGPDVDICFGSFVTIGGTPAASGGNNSFTYSWSPIAGLDDPNIANPSASPIMTTTYTLTITDVVSGCEATDEVTVTVLPLPIADAGVDRDVCLGSSTLLGGFPTADEGTAPYTYFWAPTTGLNDPTLANPTATPTVTTTYTLVVSDVNGCSRFDEVTVTVNPLPTVDAGADVTICEGSSILIGGTPAASGTTAPYGYFWTPAAGLDDDRIANPTASPLTTTVYTLTVIDANGCSAMDMVTVTVNPAPVVDAGADVTICPGGSTTIGGSPTVTGANAPFVYNWSPSTGLNDPTVANPVASPMVTTTYVVTVFDANLCISSDTITVTVDTAPFVSADPAGPLCASDAAITLTGTPAGGVWTGTGVTGNMFDPAVAGVGTHNVIYTITSPLGCTNSDTISIVVNSGPDATITAAGPFCETDAATTLTAATAGGMWMGPGITNVTTGTFDPAVAGAGTHTITYTVTNAQGCSATGTITITVNAGPNATITPVNPLCVNSAPVTLTTATAGGTFAGPGVNATTGVFDPALAGVGTHTITYTVTNAQGCSATGSLTVTVNAAPNATITAAGPFCSSDNATALTASTAGGFWSGPGIVDPFNGIFNPATAGVGTHTISYVVSNAQGCSATATTTVTVNAAPNATITTPGVQCLSNAPLTLTAATGGGTFSGPGVTGNTFNPGIAGVGTHTITYTVTVGGCTSTATTSIVVTDPVVLNTNVVDVTCAGNADGSINVIPTGGSGQFTYNWSTGASTGMISGLAAGTYTVTVTDINNCSVVATYNVAQAGGAITVNAIVIPTLTSQYSNGVIDITVNGGLPPYTFMWSNGATTEDIDGLAAGTYTVTITDRLGCTQVFTYTVTTEFGTSITPNDLVKNIKLYPNPTNGMINLAIELGGTHDLSVQVYDMLGRNIYEMTDEIDTRYLHSIDMSQHAAGQYMMMINIDGQVVTHKFNVSR